MFSRVHLLIWSEDIKSCSVSRRIRTNSGAHDLHTFDAPWHKEQENILSKGEDLNQFQVIWSFFVSWGVTTTFQAQVLHTNSCRKKQEYIYDLGVGISTVFKIFGHSLFYRSQDSSWAHTCNLHVHTMWCPFTQNMVKR